MEKRKKILINGQLFNLLSDYGFIWWLEKDSMKRFGFYGGMTLDEWKSKKYLNTVRGNNIEIKTVEVY